MSHSPIEFLQHILDEVDFIIANTNRYTFEQFEKDEILQRATIRSLEIIGEATKKLPPEFKRLYVHIDWKDLAGTRDKLIHDYFGIDLEIVWDIIQKDIPELREGLLIIFEQERKQ